MKPKDINVSISEAGGRVKVWNCSFYLDTPLPEEKREEARKRIEKAVASAVAEIDIKL